MKKNIFYLLSVLMSTFASAQQCSKSDFEYAYATVNSHELNDHIGNFDVRITLSYRLVSPPTETCYQGLIRCPKITHLYNSLKY